MIDRKELVKTLAGHRKDAIVVYTMSPQKEWPLYSDSPLDFFVGGAMGYASSVGLGVALVQPQRKVIVLDGDGSLLMNLGTLVTIVQHAPPNLVHFVLENGLYEISGRVPVMGRGKASLAALARAAGLKKVYEYDDLAELRENLDSLLRERGPIFLSLKVEPGPREPLKVAQTLRGAVEMARSLETALGGAKG